MAIVRDARLTVEQILGEPDYSYANTQGLVPTLVFTVNYEAIFGGTERRISEFISFVEQISIEGTFIQSRAVALPVELGGGGASQHIPREHTFLVEKKLIVNELGPLGQIPVRCRIEIRFAFPIEREEHTNTVTVTGEKISSPVGTGLVKRAFVSLRDLILGRWSPNP